MLSPLFEDLVGDPGTCQNVCLSLNFPLHLATCLAGLVYGCDKAAKQHPQPLIKHPGCGPWPRVRQGPVHPLSGGLSWSLPIRLSLPFLSGHTDHRRSAELGDERAW